MTLHKDAVSDRVYINGHYFSETISWEIQRYLGILGKVRNGLMEESFEIWRGGGGLYSVLARSKVSKSSITSSNFF